MGGLFGGTQKTTTNEKFDTGPSSWQKGYLDQAFGEAKNIYGQSAGSPYYQGDTYAGLDDNTKASLDRLKSYASGTALDGAGRISRSEEHTSELQSLMRISYAVFCLKKKKNKKKQEHKHKQSM